MNYYKAPYRKIVEIQPDREGTGRVIGTVCPIKLECEHVVECNPTFTYKIGTTIPCYACLANQEARKP